MRPSVIERARLPLKAAALSTHEEARKLNSKGLRVACIFVERKFANERRRDLYPAFRNPSKEREKERERERRSFRSARHKPFVKFF